jgi:organic hydroperoxide reductase OsmC/OhrA
MGQKKTYRTFQFDNVVAWKSEFRGTLSASGHSNIEVGNPPVFKGTPDVWCPEDLLIGALNACLMLTFLYEMQRRKLEVLAYESSGQGTLEHRDGKHRLTRIVVQARISLQSGNDMEAAREAIKDTVDSCMISNSILATVQMDPQFDVPLNPAQ